jgi:hypothetical protein
VRVIKRNEVAMPTFEVVPVNEAMRKSTGSRRARQVQEYITYIEQLGEGQAGKLTPAEGETALTVRRRLSSAAKLSGRDLKISRAGDEIYFWTQTGAGRRRRGRPPKASR